MPSRLLTKSKYISGLQCLKLLWTQINEPESTLELDTVTQYMFNRGISLVNMLSSYFPVVSIFRKAIS